MILLSSSRLNNLIAIVRDFKSVDLFEFIDKSLNFKYCIRCTMNLFNNNQFQSWLNSNSPYSFIYILLYLYKYIDSMHVCSH